MSSSLLALGVSHKTAPVALRERLALPEGRAVAVLRELLDHPQLHEAVAISTCNRTELYLYASDAVEAESVALAALARQAGTPLTELLGRIYSLRSTEAVRHLFSVAAGLDSMVLGEHEIQGQVKRAYELALAERTTGPLTNRLFRDALAAGKRARSETGIGRSQVSVATVAVELARATLGELASRRVLVIGTGEQGEVTARALADAGVHTVFVANRRYDRALGLAQRYGGSAIRFDDLPRELVDADIVVSCTASPHLILDHDELALVLDRRGRRQLVLIDIAVPRDIDPRARELCGVDLFDMDDLQREVARNLSGREAEAERARAIVDEEVERFEAWLGTLDVVPTIAALRERGEAIVEQLLRENEPRWEGLSEADRERVRLLAHTVVKRLLHEPTLRLKQAGADDGYRYVEALRELFGIAPGAGADAKVTSLEERRRRSRQGSG